MRSIQACLKHFKSNEYKIYQNRTNDIQKPPIKQIYLSFDEINTSSTLCSKSLAQSKTLLVIEILVQDRRRSIKSDRWIPTCWTASVPPSVSTSVATSKTINTPAVRGSLVLCCPHKVPHPVFKLASIMATVCNMMFIPIAYGSHQAKSVDEINFNMTLHTVFKMVMNFKNWVRD